MEEKSTAVSSNLSLLDDFINLRGDGRGLYNEMVNYIKRILGGDINAAEDVVTDVQLKVWQKMESYDPSKGIKPWLFTIADHACIDYQRKNKRWNATISLSRELHGDHDNYESTLSGYNFEPEEGASQLRLIEDKEERERVRNQVHRLPSKLRGPIELVYFQGLKYREAAAKLQIPEGTVKSRAHKALMQLEQLLTAKRVA